MCARDEASSHRFDVSITEYNYYDVAYTNGHRVLWFGIAVAIQNYKADVGRFRWVGARAFPRSGTWTDKVEHMVVDLWATDDTFPPVYIIKVTEFSTLPDLTYTREEESIMSSALDQVTLHE